jgi:DtxR family Mn-dependent transcriptional regulator
LSQKTVALRASYEEFLESIYRLEERQGVARTGDLAEDRNVHAGTVTNVIEGLERAGYVQHEPYRGVTLTSKGRRVASDIVKRHRLSERLLSDILHIDWSKVHEPACKFEHALGDDVIEPLEKVLGYPETCPHGNPIPGRAKPRKGELKALSDLMPGEMGIVARVTEEGRELLDHLSALGLTPGTSVEVQEREPMQGPLMIQVSGATHVLSRDVASVILVRGF